jgi:hypothetical protein
MFMPLEPELSKEEDFGVRTRVEMLMMDFCAELR